MDLRELQRLVCATLALLLAACVSPVQTTWLAPQRIDKIAVAPFRAEEPGPGARSPVAPEELNRVKREVVEALRRETPLEVLEMDVTTPLEPMKLAADAILLGSVSRYDALEGSAAGAFAPAAVCFELNLRGTNPDGSSLWKGEYCEEQISVLRNLFSLRRAMERDFRWVEADELAGYGAGRLARSLKIGVGDEPVGGARPNR